MESRSRILWINKIMQGITVILIMIGEATLGVGNHRIRIIKLLRNLN